MSDARAGVKIFYADSLEIPWAPPTYAPSENTRIEHHNLLSNQFCSHCARAKQDTTDNLLLRGTSHLGQNCDLGEGWVVSYPETSIHYFISHKKGCARRLDKNSSFQTFP